MTPISSSSLPRRKRATMQNVADLAGVGKKTVSRVINGEPNVTPEMIERVRAAAAQLQYQPDMHARSLRVSDRRTQTLGLLVGSVANPFSAAIHRAVEDAALARGVAVFASSLDDDPARERGSVEAFLRRRVDGLILTTIASSQAYLGAEIDHGTPVVFVDREATGVQSDTVLADNYEASRRGVAHLVEYGHRRIAYLGDKPALFTARERFRGFRDELQANDIAVDESLVVHGLTDEAQATRAADALLASEQPPTAIFSAQNLITIGSITALRAAQQQHRVALISFDDIPMAELLEPAITVVQQDPTRIGRLAAERIFARLDGDESPPERLVVPAVLVPRGSGEIPAS